MARKRRAPNYTGALAQPIYPEDHYKFTGGLGQPIWEPDIAAIRTRAVEKMRLLFEHYKIDPSDEQSWQKLAMSLALAHVPGLQFANRPKPGRKATWKTGVGDEKTGRGDELVRAVEDVKSRTGKGTKEAIAELRKEPKWKTYPSGKPIPAQSLGARYREARARQKALASLQKDWEKELAGLFATAAPLGRPHEVTGPATKSGARAKKKPRRK
jgi:hypothetical protein